VRTYTPKPADITRAWRIVDADGLVLGRLATEVAAVLRGKHKPMFAPNLDTGDHVIVINADKVVLTSGKAESKLSYRHSGYPGGLTATSYSDLMIDRSDRVVRNAITGMLPKNRLGRQMAAKLKVYAGAEHPHAAQSGSGPAREPSPSTVTSSRSTSRRRPTG
jgi:large subunit ribosomal protein L13